MSISNIMSGTDNDLKIKELLNCDDYFNKENQFYVINLSRGYIKEEI